MAENYRYAIMIKNPLGRKNVFKFVHIADLHFGKELPGGRRLSDEEQSFWADRFLEWTPGGSSLFFSFPATVFIAQV